MARFITLLRFTAQGAKNIKKSPARAAAFRKAAAKRGVKVESQLWTAGAYDGLIVLSAANEAKVLGAVASLAAQGNVHTETLRAFDVAEFAAITAG